MGGKKAAEWQARPLAPTDNRKVLHQPATKTSPLSFWVALGGGDTPKNQEHREVRVTIPPEQYDHLYGLLAAAICERDDLLPPGV